MGHKSNVEFLIFCNLFTRKKTTKSSIHVKRDIYIKVNTSLCPKKTIESPIERKSPFPDESAGWPAFLWKQGTQKKSSNVSFPLFMLFMQQNPSLSKMEVLYSSYRIFFDNFRFHSTNRLIKLFNSACHHHQSPSNQYSYYKF